MNANFAKLATKKELKAEQDKIVQLQVFHLTFFCGINSFKDVEAQNYLGFHPVSRYFEIFSNTNKVTVWKTEEKSDESSPRTSNNSFNPGINFIDNAKVLVTFDGKN